MGKKKGNKKSSHENESLTKLIFITAVLNLINTIASLINIIKDLFD